MTTGAVPGSELLASALSERSVATDASILEWVAQRTQVQRDTVHRTPLAELDGWRIDPATGDISHQSGRFFAVTGLAVDVLEGDRRRSWSQPVIVQPEVGILGFIAQRFDGILHVLVQAKMEPGNVNLVQISPSVQATRSNYTQVHGGRRPPFVEYFLEPGRGTTLVDQLHSEQGARYLHKRNRNAIVQITDDKPLHVPEEFRWVTIAQLHSLSRHPNLVHLDCRSILGSLTFGTLDNPGFAMGVDGEDSFGRAALKSLMTRDDDAEHTLAEVLGWLAGAKIATTLHTRRIPLNRVDGWKMVDGELRHENDRYFRVVGVAVTATSREVGGWSQPLVQSAPGGIVGLLAQKRRGVLHFLVQARVEPGFIDAVELAPTVQCAPINYQGECGQLPPFTEIFLGASGSTVHVDTLLSEEGGRFYRSQQRHMVVEVEADAEINPPPSWQWMTLAQIQSCARFSNMLDIELRSVLACIPLR